MKEFLPISQGDINARGWEQIDFCLSAAMPMLIILLLDRLLFVVY